MIRLRIKTRRRLVGEARCADCGQFGERTREWARQHARKNGHVVAYRVDQVTTYTPEETTP